MKQALLRQRLIEEMEKVFPARWEVSRLRSRVEGDRAKGTIKIHCATDDKTFMSDYEAKLDQKGRITEFALDGVVVKRKLGCPDESGTVTQDSSSHIRPEPPRD